MKHEMKLRPSPFAQIASRTKTIELRLNDEKRRQIQLGDTILFTNTENPHLQLMTQVTALHKFPSFTDLFHSLAVDRCGFAPETTIPDAAAGMRQYYSEEQEAKYGVLGIEIQLIDVIKPDFRTSDTGILYLYPYYPTWFHEHVGFSERIVDFKKNDPAMVKKFSEEMAAAFSDWDSDWTIVVVPSRKENEWGPHLLTMAQTIMEQVHFSDGAKLICRNSTQRHLALQGEYSAEGILESLELAPEAEVQGKKILLLDDVADTGKTMQACESLLRNGGASEVRKAAVAKTVQGALFCAF